MTYQLDDKNPDEVEYYDPNDLSFSTMIEEARRRKTNGEDPWPEEPAALVEAERSGEARRRRLPNREPAPTPEELAAIKQAELEAEIAEVMVEPPGGYSGGRAKTAEGGWRPLDAFWDEDGGGAWQPADPSDTGSTSAKRYIEKPRKHGTEYTYRVIKCRCETCRAYKSAQNAKRPTTRRGRFEAAGKKRPEQAF